MMECEYARGYRLGVVLLQGIRHPITHIVEPIDLRFGEVGVKLNGQESNNGLGR